MNTYKVLRRVMLATRADRLIWGFIAFFLVVSVVIWLREPQIETWGDACWYCFSVVSTCGFGDFIVNTPLSRTLSVILSIYAVVIIAIVTGVIVNYYNKIIEARVQNSLTQVMNKLERLPELSHEELVEISNNIKKLR